jgi:putative Ca2+/H+ antiporter (TMEM165/GDT1 family)
MAFAEIVVVAALAQLAVLPGEKVQFIIAGLSTRFSPLLVVGAAGLAFALWTTLEIIFGQALKGVLPELGLALFTAALFLLFAVLLARSAPAASGAAETDGGVDDRIAAISPEFEVRGHTVGGRLGTFLTIFVMMAAGEFGDKTQLVTIGLAVEYGATPAIWVGEMIAIIPVSLANAFLFHRFAHTFDIRRAHFFGAALFAFFGLDTLLAILTGVSVWETVVGVVSEVVLGIV